MELHSSIGHIQLHIDRGYEIRLPEMEFDVYVSEPPEPSKKGVIIAYDIWGFGLPNTRKFVDQIAAQGYLAVMPDIARKSSFKLEHTGLFMEQFCLWLKENPFDRVQADIAKTVNYMFDHQKIEKLAILGFGWGGRHAFNAAQKHKRLSSAIILHAGGLIPDQFEHLTVPTLILHAEIEPLYTDEQVTELTAAAKASKYVKWKVFKNMEHGFILRGDISKPEVLSASKEAIDDVMQWLKEKFE